MALDGREAKHVRQGKSRNLGLMRRAALVGTRAIILIKGRRTSRVGTCSKKRPTMNGQAEGFRLECKRLPLDFTTCDQSSITREGQAEQPYLVERMECKKKHGMSRDVVVSFLVVLVFHAKSCLICLHLRLCRDHEF